VTGVPTCTGWNIETDVDDMADHDISTTHCMLTSASLAIGQLTGRAPTDAQIVHEAMHTPSMSKPGAMMYRGRKTDDRVSVADMRQLLTNHGIGTAVRTYSADAASTAVDDLTSALADRDKAVLVVLRGPVEGVDRAELVTDASAQVGRESFMPAWKETGYTLIVAEVVETPQPRRANWTRLRPRRETADLEARPHLVQSRRRR
jgi:hypothetical protein